MRDLETKRLLLRKFTLDDAPVMFFNWANDPEVTKYMTWNHHKNIDETKAILSKWVEEYNNPKTIRYGITLKNSGELIGGIDVVKFHDDGNPEIGYCLSRRYWNQGIMTEACTALLTYLGSIGYTRAYIAALVDNIGSNRVIEKCGFKFIKRETQVFSPFKSEVVTVNHYVKELSFFEHKESYESSDSINDEDDEYEEEELTIEERRERALNAGWDEEEMDLEEFEDYFM